MPSQTRSSKPAPNILKLLCGHYDLVLNLADVMSDMKQYASLSNLAMINQDYHAVLQPYLKSTKRRIVVELSDLRKLSKIRYRDIEIVECGPNSAIPVQSRQDAKKKAQSRYDAGLKPWLLTFHGTPERYLPKLQEDFAPGVDVVRVVDGAPSRTSVQSAYDPNDCHPYECGCYELEAESRTATFDAYMKSFFVDSHSKGPLHVTNFRYQATESSSGNRSPTYYEASYEMDMLSASGNTLQYRRQGYTYGGFHNILYKQEDPEQDYGCDCYMCCCEYHESFGFDGLAFQPAKGKIRSVSFRTYLFAPDGISIDSSFQNRRAYTQLSEELRSMASHHLNLAKTDAQVSFDLYIHHGQHPRQLRENMEPVYSLRIVPGPYGVKAIIDRMHIDEDFLDCRTNNGCGRCTSPSI